MRIEKQYVLNFDTLDGGSSVVRCRRFETNDREVAGTNPCSIKKLNPVNPISIELKNGKKSTWNISELHHHDQTADAYLLAK